MGQSRTRCPTDLQRRRTVGLTTGPPSKATERAWPAPCDNSIRACRTPFPPRDPAAIVQTAERNRGRLEARCLLPFDTTAEAVDFPFVEQAARLTRCLDSDRHPARGIETEYLITSCPAAALPAAAFLQADRDYWGIECGLHLRWDVSAGEDRSRVRHRTSALNLAVRRRAALSVTIHWIRLHPPRRRPTTTRFFDAMRAQQRRKAFSLVTVRHPNALQNS